MKEQVLVAVCPRPGGGAPSLLRHHERRHRRPRAELREFRPRSSFCVWFDVCQVRSPAWTMLSPGKAAPQRLARRRRWADGRRHTLATTATTATTETTQTNYRALLARYLAPQ